MSAAVKVEKKQKIKESSETLAIALMGSFGSLESWSVQCVLIFF